MAQHRPWSLTAAKGRRTPRRDRGPRLGALGGALVLAGALCLPGLIAPASAQARVPIYTTSDLNVRTCASTSCEAFAVIPQGQCVIGIAWANDSHSWVKVRFNGRIGFVSAAYVRRGC